MFEKIIKEFKKLKETPAPPRMTMKVCMLGPRGVGKTSVITSMYNNHKEAVKGSELFLAADQDTAALLDDKKICLDNIFHGCHQEGSLMTESGIPGDSSESLFQFTYGMNSERVNIDLEIRDYPGEYLVKEPEIVADYIREASAVLVAIDTPCLMEEGGRYHEGKNRPELVTDFLIRYLDQEGSKLVLFVPLKCEKYYLNDTIDQVRERVRESYRELIDYLRDKENVHGLKNKICCAVTPIQTLGGVAFDSFETDENGRVREISTPDGKQLPAGVNYHYVTTDAKYAPKYCVQPLYYLLSFVSKQYQRLQAQEKVSGWLGKLRETFRLIPNVDNFMLEIASLGLRRMDGTGGYKVLFGRGRL